MEPLESISTQHVPSKRVADQIENCFTYTPPKCDQPARYVAIRDAAKGFALLIASYSPESREQSLAFTHLEQAVMFANAAIARHE